MKSCVPERNSNPHITEDPKLNEYALLKKERLGDVAQKQSTCVACVRFWIPYPITSPKTER
jgi:hypothetical protein